MFDAHFLISETLLFSEETIISTPAFSHASASRALWVYTSANFLFPLKKALRANEENIKRFENEKIKLEANNLETKKQAENLKEKIKGKKFVLIRSASESGALYGSVTARDIQLIMQENDISISKSQIELNKTIKELGIVAVPISLHPELSVEIQIIVARSEEEALAQEPMKKMDSKGTEGGAKKDADMSKVKDAPKAKEGMKAVSGTKQVSENKKYLQTKPGSLEEAVLKTRGLV